MTSESENKTTEAPRWLDKPGNVTLLYRGLWILCGLLAVADFFYAHHPIFKIEEFPVFYGLYAFIAGIAVVFVGRGLRKFLKRGEDYYDR